MIHRIYSVLTPVVLSHSGRVSHQAQASGTLPPEQAGGRGCNSPTTVYDGSPAMVPTGEAHWALARKLSSGASLLGMAGRHVAELRV